MPEFTFLEELKQATTNFFFSFSTRVRSPINHIQGNSPTFDTISELQLTRLSLTKLEFMFKSDVSAVAVAVAVVVAVIDAKVPQRALFRGASFHLLEIALQGPVSRKSR